MNEKNPYTVSLKKQVDKLVKKSIRKGEIRLAESISTEILDIVEIMTQTPYTMSNYEKGFVNGMLSVGRMIGTSVGVAEETPIRKIMEKHQKKEVAK